MYEKKQPQVADLCLLYRERERAKRRGILYDPVEQREFQERGNEKHKGETESPSKAGSERQKEAKCLTFKVKALGKGSLNHLHSVFIFI